MDKEMYFRPNSDKVVIKRLPRQNMDLLVGANNEKLIYDSKRPSTIITGIIIAIQWPLYDSPLREGHEVYYATGNSTPFKTEDGQICDVIGSHDVIGFCFPIEEKDDDCLEECD